MEPARDPGDDEQGPPDAVQWVFRVLGGLALAVGAVVLAFLAADWLARLFG
ncbi:MAG: hypothetical protein JWO69_1024 [Thermoleophilia bacterium]|jgi:hypothetical protein|nr:hypothetical protein [Thermoleophilia bacterium]